MCTATWLIRPEGFDLFFNRDEKNERSPADGPQELVLGGRRVLAPRDPDGGGTWIGVNELGLALGLLNAWDLPDVAPRAGEPRSRGLLVRDLLDAGDLDEVEARLAGLDLELFRGFHLAAFAPGRAPHLHSWDGRALATRAAEAPLSSSSWNAGIARAARRGQLERLGRDPGGLDAETLLRFHASHEPERGPVSVCMHRDDASTVSATHVHVGPDEVRLRYAPGSPCTTPLGAPLRLRRGAPVRGGGAPHP